MDKDQTAGVWNRAATIARLRAITERQMAATPGPWRSTWDDDQPERDDAPWDTTIIESLDADTDPKERMVVGTMYYDGLWAACSAPNAAFIANCPADIGYLMRVAREAMTVYEAATGVPGVVPLPKALAQLSEALNGPSGHIQEVTRE
jgi:hypothetical protein